MLFLGEYSVSNVSRKILKGLPDHRGNIRVTLSKLWREVRIQSDDVVKHEHLPVTKPPRPYPDRWNGHSLGYDSSDLFGYHFQNNSKYPGFLERFGIRDELVSGIGVSALNPIPSMQRCCLRSDADMSQDGNSYARDGLHSLRSFATSFDLDRLYTAFLYESACRTNGFFWRD